MKITGDDRAIVKIGPHKMYCIVGDRCVDSKINEAELLASLDQFSMRWLVPIAALLKGNSK